MSYAAVAGQPHLGNSAISQEAEVVRKATVSILENAEKSQVLFGSKHLALEELHMLAYECAESGWDGNDAAPINERAVQMAEQFVRALPSNIQMPEFACEPDGLISLDWIKAKNQIFSLSVGINNRLAYAWLDGVDKGHAVASFDGNSIPRRILEEIRHITTKGNAALWTA